MKKLKLEMFRVAKLSNPKVIYGGTNHNGDTDGTETKTTGQQQSTFLCPPADDDKDIKNNIGN